MIGMDWMICHVQIIIALTMKNIFQQMSNMLKIKNKSELHKRFMKLENNTHLLKQLYIDN
jgi:hypothetical protein